MDPTVKRYDLPDGSMATIKRNGNLATVSHRVDGTCVWFRTVTNERAEQLVGDMQARPDDFRDWWL